jgi:hypothetical protein
MARAMNVEKRESALKDILARANSNARRAMTISEELVASFGGQKTPRAKTALALAKRAEKLASALGKVADFQL